MRSMTHTPRVTGEVLVPLAETFSTLAWVSNPPRGESSGKHYLADGRTGEFRGQS